MVKGRYYTRHPIELVRYVRARAQLSKHRSNDPRDLLSALGIDPGPVLADAEKWMPTFERLTSSGASYLGYTTGVSMGGGLVLYGIVRALKPERTIETGVASGVSTTFLSAALIDNGAGELWSLELPHEEASTRFAKYGAKYEPDRGPGWAIPEDIRAHMADRHHLVLEDVATALPRLLRELREIDLFIHDDLHTPAHMLWEMRLVWPHLRSGGVLLCDDAEWAWTRFSREQGDLRLLNVQGLSGIRKP